MSCFVTDDGRHSITTRIRKGKCDRHYMRAYRRAHPKPRPAPKLCQEDDCEIRVKARDLCMKHYKAALRREKGVPERHNLTRYVQGKCKCEICTAAHTKYRAKKRKELRAKTAKEGWHGKHGTDYAYNTAGCKCDVCMEWRFGTAVPVIADDEFPKMIRDESPGMTTVHWVPAGDGAWSCPHCALVVDRAVTSESPRRDVAA